MKKLLLVTICFSLITTLIAAAFSEESQISRIENPNIRFSFPVVSNVTAIQRVDGSKIIDIWYDLAVSDSNFCTVSLKVSHNGGASYTIIPEVANISGDIGPNISPGTGKHISWNAGAEHFVLDGQFIYRVEADDASGVSEFVTVATAGPSLLVGTTEVTQASYQQIMGVNPSNIVTDPVFPVHNVTYWDAVKYCNQRSVQEGLTPYYIWRKPCHSYPTPYGGYVWPDWPEAGEVGDYFSSGGGFVYMEYLQQHMSLGVEPRVFEFGPQYSNGYRLLTEDEWEFVAKGGLVSSNYTYSGSNTADSVSWYANNSAGLPHQVGTKAPNELGIYDMSGNVQEWVYDRFRYNLNFMSLPPFAPLRWTTIGNCKGGWWALGESSLLPDYTYQREAGGQSQTISAYPSNYTAGFRICRTLSPDLSPVPVTISPAGITYTIPIEVTMSCPSIGSFITYTTDGSEPGSSSTRYTGPFSLHHTTVIKARSFTTYGYASNTVSETYTIELPPPPANIMILVEGGLFSNGVSDITLNSFYISESEIRQADYYPLMGGNPTAGYDLGLDYPVINVNWFQAIAFCNKRSIIEGLTPCYSFRDYGTNPEAWPTGWNSDGNQANIRVNWYSADGYRLPTEMEWMFAAQGGSLSQSYQYSGSDTLDDVGWHDDNSSNTTHPTKTLNPNELGLYDMSGNVWEWCWDYYASAYPAENQLNPIGPETGSYRIVRGGSYNNPAELCSTDNRAWLPPSSQASTYGFRVCRQIAATTTLGEVQFSHPSGLYSGMIEVALTSPNPQAKIRFTMNGSTPTEDYGSIYEPAEPVRIYSNVSLKAIAYIPGFLSSAVNEATYTIANSQAEGFVFVEGGNFLNGTSEITLSDFFIDDTEITQAEYQAVMSVNPSVGYGEGATYPVYNLSWFCAVDYCNRRSILEGIEPCYTYQGYGTNPDNWPSGWNTATNHSSFSLDVNQNGYRLPTEMEWMFAARGGNYTQNFIYCGANNPDLVAWHSGNAGGSKHPVGSLYPNELGLYDMGGNVLEWCWDIYADYPASSQDNPSGADSGTSRVLRGAGFTSPSVQCNPTFRSSNVPTTLNNATGLRVCRSALDTYTDLEPPVLSPETGSYTSAITVTLSSSIPGTQFRYTTDGTEPSPTTGTVYTAPIYLYMDTTLKAIAFHGGYYPSQVVMAEYYVVDQPSVPVFNPPSGSFEVACNVVITCSTPYTQIRYTTDGTEPTPDLGTIYSTPININQDTTIKAIAFRLGSPNSIVATAEYVINGIPPADLLLVSTGAFHNGTSNVTVSNMLIGKYEVTQSLYTAVMGSNPATGNGTGSDYPVYNITWFNAIEFCNRRSLMEGLTPAYRYNNGTDLGTNPSAWPTGWDQVNTNQNYILTNWSANGYRLPTEMEWMFAARGGNLTQGYTYCGSNDINAVSWYNANANNATHPMAQLQPNELGLYDIGGNVWEWCWDFYADNYPSGDQNNPTGPVSGQYRLLRGGCFASPVDQCTPVFRNTIWPTYVTNNLGFRICRSAPQETVTTPVFSPGGGTYNTPQNVSIACAQAQAAIYYTTDGTDPTETSSLYSNSLTVKATLTLKARAYLPGWLPSPIQTAEYILPPTVANPAFSLSEGVYEAAIRISISCSTPEAQIRFTTDGTEPTEEHGTLYTSSIQLAQTTVLKAIAYRTDYLPSLVVMATYTIMNNPESGLVLVEGGTFHNGASNVTISSFYMVSQETTQSSYLAVMGNNPALGYGSGDDYPAYNTTWFNAVEYCNRRSISEGLAPVYSYNNGMEFGTDPAGWPSGWNQADYNQNYVKVAWTANGYRLPTEMEWMFAALGGTQSQGYTYCGSNDINIVSWYNANSGNTTHPAAQLQANELGLFDMGGNVWEWCWDFNADNYPTEDQTNPTGPATGQYRRLRGGCVISPADQCTPVFRNTIWPTFVTNNVGFRICRSLATAAESVLAPVFNQPAGSYPYPMQVVISTPTLGASIRYTTDGTDPTPTSGTIFTNPISVSQDVILKAIAYRSGFIASSITSAAYTISGILPSGFVFVEGGTFHNGTSNVTLSGFFLETKETTQEAYTAVMGSNPATGYGTGNEYPVYYTTWFNAVEYCNRRSIADSLNPVYGYDNGTDYGTNPANWPAGWNQSNSNQIYISANWAANGYRLPTEMEWMYAARGGNISQGYTYCGSNDINAVSWYSANSGNTTHPAAQLQANELGLYDMGGNVWEWCWDFLANNYPSEDQTNPTGPATGQDRILLGGSAFSPSEHCNSEFRNSIWPTFNNNTLGFRVVRSFIN